MAEQKRSTAKRTPVPNVPPSANRAALDTEPSAPSIDSANLALFQEKLYDLALASLDRVRAAGVAVQVIAAISGVGYAAILAYLAVTGDAAPLLRSLVAPFFLALGLVLGALSLAAGRLPRGVAQVAASGGAQDRADARLSFFTRHVERSAASSTGFARSGAIAVAIGLAAAVLPFIGVAVAGPAPEVAPMATVADRTVVWPEQPEVASKITEETYFKAELYRAQLAEAVAAADREFEAEQARLESEAADARAAALVRPPAPTALDSIPLLAAITGGGLLLVALPGVAAAITRRRLRADE